MLDLIFWSVTHPYWIETATLDVCFPFVKLTRIHIHVHAQTHTRAHTPPYTPSWEMMHRSWHTETHACAHRWPSLVGCCSGEIRISAPVSCKYPDDVPPPPENPQPCAASPQAVLQWGQDCGSVVLRSATAFSAHHWYISSPLYWFALFWCCRECVLGSGFLCQHAVTSVLALFRHSVTHSDCVISQIRVLFWYFYYFPHSCSFCLSNLNRTSVLSIGIYAYFQT